MSKIAALLVLVAVAALGAGCASREVDVPQDQMLGTPRQTVNYLRWAFAHSPADDRPRHVWNCLSEEFKKKNNLTLSDLELFWKEVDENLRKYLGDVETVEIVDRRDLDDRHAELDIESGDHRATVLFVLETQYEIRPWSGRKESISGGAASMDQALKYVDDKAIVTLPNVRGEIAPKDVYRISIENGWKVDRIVRHNLDELERSMRNAKKTPQGL